MDKPNLNMLNIKENPYIILDNGKLASAVFPVIISASRSTDIPAFYADWFFERLKKGYSIWINPFNQKRCPIAYKNVKFIVFWSKNPEPLLGHLDWLDDKGIGYYIHFTLNDYEREKLEENVPPLAKRMNTFKVLAQRLGKKSVIWRFDPLILTESIDIETLLARIRKIGNEMHEFTEKLVFSFVDIFSYRRVKTNLARNRIVYKDWSGDDMQEFARKLVELNKSEGWNLKLATCGELGNFPGVEHNRCIDDHLILRIKHDAPELLKFLGASEYAKGELVSNENDNRQVDLGHGKYIFIEKHTRDKGQRKACGCIKSKDIGQYFTCLHNCKYCYANSSEENVKHNYALHKRNPGAETITGY